MARVQHAFTMTQLWWETFIICNSYPSLSYIIYCSSYSHADSLSISGFFKCFFFFPVHWHFLHAFVDSFQGCYKDETEPGTIDCRWFAQFGLFFRLSSFICYALSPNSMYLLYAAVICTLWLILLVNVNPFKSNVSSLGYPLTDLVFLVLINLFYISLLGRDIASMEGYVYLCYYSIIPIRQNTLRIVH